MTNKLYVLALVSFGFFLNIVYSNISNRSKLNQNYIERLTEIKGIMLYGSANDTMKELNDYQDQTELCMHLDGYNGIEIMNIRSKAFTAAFEDQKNKSYINK